MLHLVGGTLIAKTEDRQALYLRDERSWGNFESGNLIITTRSIDCQIKKQFAIIYLGDTRVDDLRSGDQSTVDL